MAQKDADLASDYTNRDLFIVDQLLAEFEVEAIPSLVNLFPVELFIVDQLLAEFEVTLGPGKGGGSDTSPPVIANVTPASGTQLSSRSAPVEFDVTDVDPGIKVVIITVKYTTRPETQVVFNGADFITPFNSAGSQMTAITDGYHFKITPENQWLGDIQEFFVYAIDKSGNLEGLP